MSSALRSSDVSYSDTTLAELIAAGTTNTRAAYEAVTGATPDLVDRAISAARDSYVAGFKLVYLVAIGFGVAATIAAACTVSTDRSKKNNDRAIVMKSEAKKMEGIMEQKTVA